nr:NADH:ubiquinone reductase (Na(+)-transporting) subunit A [Prolixibacteraceae bacterium]
MPKIIKIRKGLDIKLKGKAEPATGTISGINRYALRPVDFLGLVPRMLVQPEDCVLAGTPLFYDKYRPDILFPSPVSGKVLSVIRGERRKILEIEIESDGKFESVAFSAEEVAMSDRESVKKTLLKSGLWPFIIQRPFGVIANPSDDPQAIFVSGFDSAPLSPDYAYTLADESESLQKGIDVLS